MLILDLEQFEFLSERNFITGGFLEGLQLFMDDGLIELKLDNHLLVEKNLADGVPLISKFSLGTTSGLLTAFQEKKKDNSLSQLVSVVGQSNIGSFSSSFSTLVTN